jgi:hypothetical protein
MLAVGLSMERLENQGFPGTLNSFHPREPNQEGLSIG